MHTFLYYFLNTHRSKVWVEPRLVIHIQIVRWNHGVNPSETWIPQVPELPTPFLTSCPFVITSCLLSICQEYNMQMDKNLDPPFLNQPTNTTQEAAVRLLGGWPGHYWYLGTDNVLLWQLLWALQEIKGIPGFYLSCSMAMWLSNYLQIALSREQEANSPCSLERQFSMSVQCTGLQRALPCSLLGPQGIEGSPHMHDCSSHIGPFCTSHSPTPNGRACNPRFLKGWDKITGSEASLDYRVSGAQT